MVCSPNCSRIVPTIWGDPLKSHKIFGHTLRLYFHVFAACSRGWGLGKGTAFESPLNLVEACSSFPTGTGKRQVTLGNYALFPTRVLRR